MNAIKIIRSLGPIDVKSFSRDSFLRWMIFYPIAMGALLRWGIPFLAEHLVVQFQFNLVPYYPLLMSFVLLIMPLISGVVIGFLLLDQRDDHTLTALQVTPLTLKNYLAYRISIPVVLSILMTIVTFQLANLVKVEFFPLLISAVVAAPGAPLFALFLAAFAKNKVQGFALMKMGAGIIYPPLIAYFIPSGIQILFGLVPTYWPVKLFWMLHAGESGYWIYIVLGLIYQFALIALLMKRFNRVMHKS